MQDIQTVVSNIRSLKIQGATNVALAVLDTLEAHADLPTTELRTLGEQLAYARPTEPLAQNAVRYIFAGNDIAARIRDYRQCITDGKQSIPQAGKSLLVDGGSYLTICHSSTAVALFRLARENGAMFSVYVAETRPLYQGRITAKELLSLGFEDVTMVIDDVAVSMIEGRVGAIDAVFMGADLLTDTGFVNKVGSLAIATAAAMKGIPVYSLSSLLKFDPRPYTPSVIETRSAEEIWADAPKGLKFYAPAFDFVPFTATTRVICEAGVIEGHQVRVATEKIYPFISEGGK